MLLPQEAYYFMCKYNPYYCLSEIQSNWVCLVAVC